MWKRNKQVLNLVDDFNFKGCLLEKKTAKILIVNTYSKSSWKILIGV